MVEKDHTQEQTIEYNEEAYVRQDDAQTAARMLAEYLEGNNMEAEARIVNSIRQVLAARGHTPETGDEMYGARVTYVDADGEAYAGVVMEPNVTEMTYDEVYDPNKDEFVDPADYPMGTVQLLYYPDGIPGEDVFFDRLSDLEVATSVTPATHPGDEFAYFPGWEYARESREE